VSTKTEEDRGVPAAGVTDQRATVGEPMNHQIAYRSRFSAQIQLAAIWSVAVVVLYELALGPAGWETRLLALTATFVFGSVSLCVASWARPLIVSAEGVVARTWWGTKRFVRWDEVKAVKSYWLLTFRWMRVSVKTGAPVYIPVALTGSEPFAEVVMRSVPPDHPMAMFLSATS
jgi:hypothetical protein